MICSASDEEFHQLDNDITADMIRSGRSILFLSVDLSDFFHVWCVLLTFHLHGLKLSGSSYISGFRWTAGGHTITPQPAGIVYPVFTKIWNSVSKSSWQEKELFDWLNWSMITKSYILLPFTWISFSAFLKMPGTMFANLAVSAITYTYMRQTWETWVNF